MSIVDRTVRRLPFAPAVALVLPAAIAVGAGLAHGGDCGIPAPVAVYLEGDPAPVTGDLFQTFDRPNIGEETDLVAFTGLTDGDSSSNDVIYVGETLVAREGDPAPAITGGTFGTFEFFETGHQVNGSGTVGFIANIRDVPALENRAVYDSLLLVAQSGKPAPLAGGPLFDDFGFVGATAKGTVGFLADLDGPASSDSVIYLYEFMTPTILYREGDAVPTLTGVTFDGNFDEIQWNCTGDLLFEGNTSLPTSEDMVVFRRRTLEDLSIVEDIVAQEGQAIAASDGADFLELILQTALAEDGSWALRGNLGVAPPDSDAIIITEMGQQVQQGAPVPELPGVVLGNFNAVDINSHGDLLFLADLEGETPPGVDEGLFVNGCLVATTGEALACLPEGDVLTDIGFEDCWINDNRVIVFAASYTSGDGLFKVDLGPVDPCAADTDGNGFVDFADLLFVLAEWGPCPDCQSACPADVDGSGEVDFGDLLELLATWGPCS